MKKVIQVGVVAISAQLLAGCLATVAPIVAGGVAGTLLENKMLSKKAESKPPKYIEISQQGRIITASFEIKGFSGTISNRQGAQMRGFNEWATAAITREAPKRGCINIINAFSAGQGIRVTGNNAANKLQFKCLDKETIMSEQDTLEDKKVIYAEQIAYIESNPSMIVYK